MRLRPTLLPIAWLYGAVLRLRHALYDAGLLKSVRPSIPTIAIGNLAFGGTGKTPMLELVLRELKDFPPIATLSRGYGRNTRSIHEVRPTDDAQRSGDEPVQVKRKFPHVRVFVGADRRKAIAQIRKKVPGVKAVVLDDALQHRRLDAGMNILLTTWDRPWTSDHLFPAGGLRDLPMRAAAAGIIVVTKCPARPSSEEESHWRHRLKLRQHQELFFSGIAYEPARTMEGTHVQPQGNVLLFTGIADPAPLREHLGKVCEMVDHVAFQDHHGFTHGDLSMLADRFGKFAPPKMLVTTEKDLVRILPLIKGSALDGLPLAVIGMRAVILNDPARFGNLIKAHVGSHQAHR